MTETCYMCSDLATTDEHAPPKSFFPEGKRNNLITVPSCKIHNNNKSGEDEYIRNIFCLINETNMEALKLGEGKVYRSFERNRKSLQELLKDSFEYKLSKEISTIAFTPDFERINIFMKSLAYAIYRYEFKENYTGEWRIFDGTSFVRDKVEDMESQLLEITKRFNYLQCKTDNPDIFQFFKYQEEKRVLFKFIFYEHVCYYAGTLKRLSEL